MHPAPVAAAVAAAACGGSAGADPAERAAFASWMGEYTRSYATREEHAERFANFRTNAARVRALAGASPLAVYAPDEFADWSDAELRSRLLRRGMEASAGAEPQRPFTATAVAAAARAGPIDWVEKGAVTSPGDPKNKSTWVSQGRCGTCAQFSAIGDIEAQWHLAGNPLEYLSIQEMIDCSSYTGPYGMGWVSDIHKGIDKAVDYPLANHSDPTLAGCRSPCNNVAASKSFAHIDGATCGRGAIHDDEAQMMAWLQHGPLSVSVDSGPFNGYKGGIISGATCNSTNVGHAPLLVGYGVDAGVAYWKLKNSWGPMFGEGGYVRIQHGVKCLGLRGACQAYIGEPPAPSSYAVQTSGVCARPILAAAQCATAAKNVFNLTEEPDVTEIDTRTSAPGCHKHNPSGSTATFYVNRNTDMQRTGFCTPHSGSAVCVCR